MIAIENISKSFGGQTLFESAGFKVNARERIGLVGRNGHGKTTLLRILIGEEESDEGRVVIPKNYRIGYVQQHLKFSEPTLLAEGALGLRPEERDQLWRVEKVLAGLGFSQDDMQRHPSEFSGGYQVRLNLAKVLVSDPNLLLLDEPTNYLDITSIRWIESFLLDWPGELLLITHDRAFMDRVVTHTVGIHRKKMRKIAGDTSAYYNQIAQDEEIYEKTRLNDERKRKDMELFINRFRAKARLANMVQSRVKTLEKSRKLDKLEDLRDLDFAFREAPFAAKQMMSVKDLAFGYDEPLFSGLDLNVGVGEKICVIGRNGKGKTTLLRLLAGELNPGEGEIRSHPATVCGYFSQTNSSRLNPALTVEDEVRQAAADLTPQQARNICGAMMFEGDFALKKVAVLSGGEKSRVMLGQLLASPLNLLLLDEPTNHLDMESCDALVAALDRFEGTLIMVTHNEMFLHALADRLVVFDGGRVTVHDGTYQDFLERVGWQEESDQVAPQVKESPKLSKKDLRRLRSEIISERSKIVKPIEKMIAGLEDELEKLDIKLQELNQDLLDASARQEGGAIQEISCAMHDLQQRQDQLFDQLEVCSDDYDQHKLFFDAQLEELGDI